MGIKVIGGKLVISNLKKAIKKIEGKLTRVGMLKVGKLVMKRSKALTPMDKGNLMESAFVVFGGNKTLPQAITTNNFNTTEPEGKRVAAEHGSVIAEHTANRRPNPFSIIGYSAFYALKEHEAMDEVHDIGFPKFLETAVVQSHRDILKILKESVKR
ncbi:hypothetical protein HN682_10155 [Candidatus Peregrinibacteria bacterium]|jgi:hypothetical protein|nr:hypothetical protein [Candidatus Peregrinibacteria bacterium]